MRNPLSESGWYMLQIHLFVKKIFFKGFQKIFCVSYDHVQYIWKVVQDHILTLKNKLESYDTSNELYGRKRKKFGFLKNPLSELGWDMLQKSMFFEWIFFQMLLKNFLFIVWLCSKYWKGCPRPYLYARKKLESYDK